MKFDSIVGNPPFNTDRSAGKGSTSTLWDVFVERSLHTIKDGGYILYVHPSNWRKPGHYLWPILSIYSIKYLKMFSLNASKNIFDAGTKVDFYCLQKLAATKDSKVIDANGIDCEVNLKKWPFLPNGGLDTIKDIISLNPAECCNILYDTTYHGIHTSDVETADFCNKVVHTIRQDGPRFRYSLIRNGHYGVKKIILNEGGKLYPINDATGQYAMSQGTFGIVIDDDAIRENIMKALQSKEFEEKVVESIKWGIYRIDYKFFRHLKKDFWKKFV